MIAPTRHQAGGWLSMAGNDLWLLTNAAADDPIAAPSWQLICEGAALHQLVAMYTERPDLTYALAGSAGEITQVVVRGPVRVEVATPAGVMVISGADDGGDWAGHVIPDPVLNMSLIGGATVGGPPAVPSTPWLQTPPVSAPPVSAPPVSAPPVVSPPPAARVEPAAEPPVAETPVEPPAFEPAPESPAPEPAQIESAPAEPHPEEPVFRAFEPSRPRPPESEEPPQIQATAPDADADREPEDVDQAEAAPIPEAPVSPPRQSPFESPAFAAVADALNVRWSTHPNPPPATSSWASEATSVVPLVERRAPAATEPTDAEPAIPQPAPLPAPGPQAPLSPLLAVEPAPIQQPPAPPRIGGLISDVSWAEALSAPAAPAAPAEPHAPARPPEPPAVFHTPPVAPYAPAEPNLQPPAPEPFSDTTMRQDLDITIWRPIAETSVMTGGGLTVTAIRCVDGHLNPLIATSCRVCAKAVPPQSSVIVPRPPLGVLRMSTSDTIRLDHGVIFGRDPGTPDANRRDQPYFVKLTDKDISRRHLEVVLDGWDVIAVDLNSSNGSAITMPGGMAEVIPGGTRRLLLPGTIVHLSDTISFVYEVTP